MRQTSKYALPAQCNNFLELVHSVAFGRVRDNDQILDYCISLAKVICYPLVKSAYKMLQYAYICLMVSTDNPSTVSRSLSRMSSVSIYTDEPPPYNVVVRNHRRKLRRHHSHPGPTRSCTEEPPPSYESVVIFSNRGQQTDPPPYIRVLQYSQSRSRRRSLESSQTALEIETSRQNRLSSAATTSDRSPEQSQRSSGGQQTVVGDVRRENDDTPERTSLLSEGATVSCP